MRGTEWFPIPDINKDPMKELAERCMAEASLLFPYKDKKKKGQVSSNTGNNKIGRTKE